MLRLFLSFSLAALAACDGRGSVVEEPPTPVAVALWVAPDMAFALPLPEGWAIESSDAVVNQPMYRAEIEALEGQHPSGVKPICRLGVVDFRLLDDFLLHEDPDLPSEEVDDLVRIMIKAVEEDVWPINAYKQLAYDASYECHCEDKDLVATPEGFRAVHVSDTQSRSSWHVRIESPRQPVSYTFYASRREITEKMFTQIDCAYPSYSERAHRNAGDLAALSTAIDHLESVDPKPERVLFR